MSEKTIVRLRLTPKEAAELTTAGANATPKRKLAAEVAHRVREPASRFPGWPVAEAQEFEHFGEAAARLLAGITVKTGTKMSLRERLGMMRAVLPVLLDGLGTSIPNEEDAEYFRSWAKDALTDASAPHKVFAGYLKSEGIETEHVESDLVRLVRELTAKVENGGRQMK